MKKGKYTGATTTWHGFFGMLVPDHIYDLPDSWDFEHETLFEPVYVEKAEPVKTEKPPARKSKGDN